MKTNAKQKTSHTPEPQFVLSHIEDVRIDGFLHEVPALVDVNAPRALIQATAEGHLQGVAWMLRQPLYAAAPDLLEAAKLAVHAAEYNGQERDWVGALRAVIAKAEK